MFPARYFAPSYFAPAYWPKVGATVVVTTFVQLRLAARPAYALAARSALTLVSRPPLTIGGTDTMARAFTISGSPEVQRPDEEIAYEVTIDDSYTMPSAPACALFDLTDGETDISATNLSGSAQISDGVFTSPLVFDLVARRLYRLEFRFASGGSVFEPYLLIRGVA